ncbi:MAG: transposase [Sulfurovum sp.]|nr:transposase [Sulfurovum sp.]
MPRKPRIEIAGWYHIINRGVEQRIVFKEDDDYRYFIDLMCLHAKNYGITIHNYCLMNNHYHLLIETENENLSKFMRQINMNYAIYFNKKYKRSGHLWQGRYKSWYMTDEAYLYTLILYIEQNPIKAKIVKRIEDYPYSSAHQFLQAQQHHECLKKSWITQQYRGDTDAIKLFLDSAVDSGQLQELKKASSLLEASNTDKKPDEEKLKKMLSKANNTKERNTLILGAYQKGYSQHGIAKVLGLSQPTVNGIIKREMKNNAITIT